VPWRRFVIAKLREKHNLSVLGIVSNGWEAIRKARELHPDLILLDVSLPDMSGIQVGHEIRSLVPESKIIFVTVNADPDIARAAFRLGAYGYVVKSDSERELLQAIDTVSLGKKFVSQRLKEVLETIDSLRDETDTGDIL
jgi:two-component system nitrate/nitrite response regulator NarL